MAHIQQFRFINFIRESLPDYFNSKKVLEIGSLNINGSVRTFFKDCDYTGIDVANGKDVDVVSNGENYYEKANTFDVIISCECMEHNPMYQKTWLNMLRMLKNDGLLIMTCATFGRPQHGTSLNEPISSPLTIQLGQDYYKNLTRNDFEIVNMDVFFSDYLFETDYSSHDLYFIGIGKNSQKFTQEKFKISKKIINDFYFKIACEGIK